MTFVALANLRQKDDESLLKFMDRFGRIIVQIQNLDLKVTLHSMLLTLRHERAKSYIQMEEMSRFRNEVWLAEQKLDKREGNTKNDSYKSDKTHKPYKHQLARKGPVTSVTYPQRPIALQSLRRLSSWRYLSSYLRRFLLGQG